MNETLEKSRLPFDKNRLTDAAKKNEAKKKQTQMEMDQEN